MAQRSSGIFPREGFNLDEELKATGASTDLSAKADLRHCKTVRVIAIAGGADAAISIGGIEVIPAATAYPAIAHVRGALLANSTVVAQGADAATSVVYVEKLD